MVLLLGRFWGRRNISMMTDTILGFSVAVKMISQSLPTSNPLAVKGIQLPPTFSSWRYLWPRSQIISGFSVLFNLFSVHGCICQALSDSYVPALFSQNQSYQGKYDPVAHPWCAEKQENSLAGLVLPMQAELAFPLL